MVASLKVSDCPLLTTTQLYGIIIIASKGNWKTVNWNPNFLDLIDKAVVTFTVVEQRLARKISVLQRACCRAIRPLLLSYLAAMTKLDWCESTPLC
jgi:hypothetical protein